MSARVATTYSVSEPKWMDRIKPCSIEELYLREDGSQTSVLVYEISVGSENEKIRKMATLMATDFILKIDK